MDLVTAQKLHLNLVSYFLLFTANLMKSKSVSHSVVSDSLWPHGLQPARFICPWRFSRQEYWSGLPFSSSGYLPNPRIEPRSPALQVDSLPTKPPGKSTDITMIWINQTHTLGYSFSKNRTTMWLCAKALWHVGDAVVSNADSIPGLKKLAAQDQPLGKKLVTKHNENYKRWFSGSSEV